MSVSEFRQDPVSGDWVLISTERAQRPGALEKAKREKFYQPKDGCPFEDPQATGHGQPVLAYLNGQEVPAGDDFQGEWTLQIVRNKYPALHHDGCRLPESKGPLKVAPADGFHELLITRDHERSFPQFSGEETQEVLKAYRTRYNQIAQDACSNYILIFHNHGPSAGASLYHNHSQIISTPILPPDVLDSIRGSDNFFREHGRKVHDVLIDWEIARATRIVYENEQFIAFCPYVSKTPYETRIYPKMSQPRFQDISDENIAHLADALNSVLKKIYYTLNDIDYNFYIHTAPVAKDPSLRYDFYTWHIEIVPRVKIDAGFELGTAVSINSIDPDEAAKQLNEMKAG